MNSYDLLALYLQAFGEVLNLRDAKLKFFFVINFLHFSRFLFILFCLKKFIPSKILLLNWLF